MKGPAGARRTKSQRKASARSKIKSIFGSSSSLSSGRRLWFSTSAATASPARRHPKAPIGKPWPVKDLVGYDFPVKSELGFGRLLVDVLRSRGWRFSDKFCHYEVGEDTHYTVWIKEFEAALRGISPKKLFGRAVEEGHRLQTLKLPARALWFITETTFKVPGTFGGSARSRDDFAQIVVKCAPSLPGSPGDYRISKFPGTETALFKTNLSAAFKGKPWWPRCYVLPRERTDLLKELGGQSKYWIAKPKNEFGGKGVRVFRADDPQLRRIVKESEGQPKSVVQSYLAHPLLIGGYKFHMRIHLLVTSLNPPEAYVQRNGQCLFATQPYTLAANTFGGEFQAPVHITNMSFNATAENKDNFFRQKPVIGKGQQFRVAQFERLLEKNHPSYNRDLLWGQVTHIAAEVVRYIARAPAVRRYGPLRPDMHFELFGMDLMLDRDLNMFMCEVNTDPGVDYPDKQILGEPNPDYNKEAGLASDTWHDTLTLLGLDAKTSEHHGKGSLRHWLKVDFSDSCTEGK